MTTTPKPAATGQTSAANQGSIKTVKVAPLRKVTYIFKATSSKNLSIPYAVAVDGKVQAAFSNKPKRVSGSGGRIETFVDQGSKASLFLNSDAHPGYRQNAVYEVTVGDNDIVVTVTEKSGKHADSDTPVRQAAKAGEMPPIDRYSAPLTGDIWMKVSHRYQASEVDALVESTTSEAVKSAVRSIYNGLASSTFTVTEPPTNASNGAVSTARNAARTLKVEFSDSNNPKENIRAYTLLTDGLTRVHPGGYAALFTAALANGIDSLSISSCWRPMLGSIAHRAGLGLDVNFVGKTRMNRQELRGAFEGKKPRKKGDGDDADNVSDAEVKAFGEYEDAIVASKAAMAERAAAQRALAAARKTKNTAAIAKAEERWNEADLAAGDAAKAEDEKLAAWNSERDAAEPTHPRLFRTSLLKCACVAQLFDPWFMDPNTRDIVAPDPNMQRGASTSNERLHAHHLHLTVHEPKIL